MQPTIDESVAPQQSHHTPVGNGSGQRFNAVKHGLYSKSIVLPGEDTEAFRRERLALFHTYRPQTIHEAKLLHKMAEWDWQLNRTSPLQAQYDEQAMAPDVDAAGRVMEPLGHKRLHSTMDVTVHRQRIDRGTCRAFQDLVLAQKLRRQGLVEGAVKVPPGCYMECSGEVVPLVAPVLPAAAPAPALQAAVAPAVALAPVISACQETGKVPEVDPVSPSADGTSRNSLEQKEMVGEVGFGSGRSTTPHPHPLPPLLPRRQHGEGERGMDSLAHPLNPFPAHQLNPFPVPFTGKGQGMGCRSLGTAQRRKQGTSAPNRARSCCRVGTPNPPVQNRAPRCCRAGTPDPLVPNRAAVACPMGSSPGCGGRIPAGG